MQTHLDTGFPKLGAHGETLVQETLAKGHDVDVDLVVADLRNRLVGGHASLCDGKDAVDTK